MNITHEEIMSLAFFIEPTNDNRIAADNKDFMDATKYRLAFGPRVTIDDQYMQLLTAAPALYQALTYQFEHAQKIIDALEQLNAEEGSGLAVLIKSLTHALTEIQNGCMLAQRVAQVGQKEVADSLKRGAS